MLWMHNDYCGNKNKEDDEEEGEEKEEEQQRPTTVSTRGEQKYIVLTI
jgi:hypothetical protein